MMEARGLRCDSQAREDERGWRSPCRIRQGDTVAIWRREARPGRSRGHWRFVASDLRLAVCTPMAMSSQHNKPKAPSVSPPVPPPAPLFLSPPSRHPRPSSLRPARIPRPRAAQRQAGRLPSALSPAYRRAAAHRATGTPPYRGTLARSLHAHRSPRARCPAGSQPVPHIRLTVHVRRGKFSVRTSPRNVRPLDR